MSFSRLLNFQILFPILVHVSRFVFSVIITAIVISVSIYAAESFFDSLENFIGIIRYWATTFVAIVIVSMLFSARANARLIGMKAGMSQQSCRVELRLWRLALCPLP